MSDHDNVDTNPVLATGLAVVALLGVLGGLLPPGLLGHLVEQAAEPAAGPTASGVGQQAAPQIPTTAGAASVAAPTTQGEVPAGTTRPAVAPDSRALRAGENPAAASPPLPARTPIESAGPAPAYRPPSAWYMPPQAPGYPAQPYLVPPYPAPYEPYDPYYGRPYRTR
jgi:hypothetical protein